MDSITTSGFTFKSRIAGNTSKNGVFEEGEAFKNPKKLLFYASPLHKYYTEKLFCYTETALYA
jgi:hypothetical protein